MNDPLRRFQEEGLPLHERLREPEPSFGFLKGLGLVLAAAVLFAGGAYWKHQASRAEIARAAQEAREAQHHEDKEANPTRISYTFTLDEAQRGIEFTSTAYTGKKLIRRQKPKLHFADTVVDDDVITFLTNEVICKGVTTPVEKTTRIMDFVTQNTRYIPDTFGDAPKFAIETLMEGGGDCEDLSALVSTMLKAANVSHGLLDHHKKEKNGHVSVAVSFDENTSHDYFPDLQTFGNYLKTRQQFTVDNVTLERDVRPIVYLNPNSFPNLDDLLTEAYTHAKMGRRAYSKIQTSDNRDITFRFALIPQGEQPRGAYFPFTNGDALQVLPIHLSDTYTTVARNLAGCSTQGDFSAVDGKDKIIATHAYHCLLSILQDQEHQERVAEERRREETEKDLPPGTGFTILRAPVLVRATPRVGNARYRDDGMWGLGKRFYVLEPTLSQDKGNWRFSSNPAESGFDLSYFIPIVE